MRQVDSTPKCWCGGKWLCLDPVTILSAHTGMDLGWRGRKKSAIISSRTCEDGSDADARDARTVNIFYGM